MRRASAASGSLKFIYPDEICFAFNPNYLEIESLSFSSFTIRVYLGIEIGRNPSREKEINATRYGSRVKIYLSKLFQLMFEEPECVRSLPITVSISAGGEMVFSFTSLVLWGSLAPGERFNALGVYKDVINKRQYERTLIWYKNFPFSVSVFKYKSDVSFRGRYDNGQYLDSALPTRGQWNFSGIDEFTVPVIVSDDFASSPSGIIYFTSLRKFIAKANGNLYYENWSGGHAYGSSTFDLMDPDTGLPRLDRDYLLTDDNGISWLYRFDGYNLVKCGMQADRGFVTLYPELFFQNAKHMGVIRYNTADLVNSSSTFDDTFDYTFGYADDTVCLVKLLVSDEMDGHYLRWIDAQGNLEYFLFKKGKTTTKTTMGSNSIEIREPLRDMYFPNMERTQNLDLTISHKCCAVHLPDNLYIWVKTILTSPIIDLFIGRDKMGNEIWIPVTIVAGSSEYNSRDNLHDLEISFNIPAYCPQSL